LKASTHKRLAIGIFSAAVCFAVIVLAVALSLGSGGSNHGGGLRFGKRLAVVRLEGEIIDAAWHVDQLRGYRLSGNVAGVLLRVDSPGGAVAPSQEIYSEVAAYRAEGKPLVVSMGNVAASGGYYVSAPAHKIFASPGTMTGSIGVISFMPVYQELAKKVGIDFRVMKAGEMKDAGNPFRQMTEKEAKYYQTLLDDIHEQFISDVAAGRNADTGTVRALSDGRVLTGRQAVESGLVDTLGGFSEALSYLGELCGVPESSKPIEKRPAMGWRELLFESAQRHVPGLGALSRRAGMYYLLDP
jgi:protease-4